MKRYRVTIHFSESYEVEAENELEAEEMACRRLRNWNTIPVPDEYEAECIDEE